MGSELEDALRAAVAAAAQRSKVAGLHPIKETGQPAGAATATVMASPSRSTKKNKMKKRQRKRSRSDSMVSETLEDIDPATRIAAFKARMFEVGKDGATTTFSSCAAPFADDVVKVQWKSKTPAATKRRGLSTSHQHINDKDDAVPQLTRAKVVTTPVTQHVQPVEAVKSTGKKKKNNKKKEAPLRVIEITVPPTQPPAPALATTAMATTYTPAKKRSLGSKSNPTTAIPAHRDDDALEFSNPSEDEATDDAASSKALVPARIAARKVKGQQTKVLIGAKPAAMASQLTKQAVATFVGTSTSRKADDVQGKRNGHSNKQVTNLQAARNGKKSNTPSRNVATNPSVTQTAAKTKMAESKPPYDADDDDKWDLDALVKKTVAKEAVVNKTMGRNKRQHQHALQGDDDVSGVLESDASVEIDHNDSEFVGTQFRHHQKHLFSRLIDEAAREQWELVEVGRLVRIFAAQWNHTKKKTARFLRRYCPELVSVDFLEGLNIPLGSKQLLKIFERGSGTPVVVMNKIASAVENGNMTVRDPDLQSFVADQTLVMSTNREIVAFLLPLLESLSKVKDVGVLLKAICEHWQVDRTASLVQDILLTPVFDDLDGQPDVILEDLPALKDRLDFPSCMDDEDADENGNLKGLVVGEESDLGESDADADDAAEEALGEVLSDDENDDDSHAEDGVYDGETDSEEEREAQERLNPTKRRRSRFVLDEADEDDDDGDDVSGDDGNGFVDDEVEEEDGDDSDSSVDSSDNDAFTTPQRKRLRKG